VFSEINANVFRLVAEPKILLVDDAHIELTTIVNLDLQQPSKAPIQDFVDHFVRGMGLVGFCRL
jgi:hypothetical protein